MSRKPSMLQAAWIAKRMEDANEDDVFDVLLGNILEPDWFVDEVKTLAIDYEEDLERNNIRLRALHG